MVLKEVLEKLEAVKQGRYVKVAFQTTKGDYKKEVETVIRFCDYANINGIEVKGKPNPNETYIVPNMVIYNSHTQQYYLSLKITKGDNKPKVRYFFKDKEIDKAAYEIANPPKGAPITIMFKKNIKDIISIGE